MTTALRPIERLEMLIGDEKLTNTAFEQNLEISNGYIYSQRKGKGSISSEIFEKLLSKYPDWNIEWIITGIGTKHKKQGGDMNEPDVRYLNKLRTDTTKQIQAIPLYNIQATAGIVDLLSDNNRQKHVPIDYISIPNLPKCDGALPITGDSMYPLLKSGDMVLYKEVHDVQNIIWGEMYLLAIVHKGDEFFFAKYVQKAERDGWLRLVSQNINHQPVEFPMKSVKALALIKASIRINTPF